MWIYLVSLTISLTLTSSILSVLIPKFKQREERENTFAAANKIVFPDKLTKGFFVFFTVFCLIVGIILLFVPQLCEMMAFDWLITNIIWWIILLIDLIFVLVYFQVIHIEYNKDFMLITNIFRKTRKVFYSEITRVNLNFKIFIIFTKKERYFISCSFFYGGEAFKSVVLEKLNGNRDIT